MPPGAATAPDPNDMGGNIGAFDHYALPILCSTLTAKLGSLQTTLLGSNMDRNSLRSLRCGEFERMKIAYKTATSFDFNPQARELMNRKVSSLQIGALPLPSPPLLSLLSRGKAQCVFR